MNGVHRLISYIPQIRYRVYLCDYSAARSREKERDFRGLGSSAASGLPEAARPQLRTVGCPGL